MIYIAQQVKITSMSTENLNGVHHENPANKQNKQISELPWTASNWRFNMNYAH
jgi:phage replication-related protein YjqB (UPF0714/DUF867 family)